MHNTLKFECCKTFHFNAEKLCEPGTYLRWSKKSPHIRNIRDGTMIKLHVNSGVYTMDMWIFLDETGPVFSW